MNKLVMMVALLVSSSAFADEAADRVKAINAAFATQTQNLGSTHYEAFEKTLTDDALVSWGAGTWPSKVNEGWENELGNIKVVGSKAGWAGTFGWIVAELRIDYIWYVETLPQKDTGTYHYLAVFVPDGNNVKAKLVRLAKTRPDSKLTASSYVQTLPKLASPSANVALLANAKDLASHLSTDAATSLVGTSDKDHAFGVAAAKKLAKAWAKVGLEVVDADDTSTEKPSYAPGEIKIGDATIVWAKLRMKLTKKQWYPIEGIAVLDKSGKIVALEYDSSD